LRGVPDTQQADLGGARNASRGPRSTNEESTMRRVVPSTGAAGDDLSTQARALLHDVLARSGDVQEQLMLLTPLARRHATSGRDVQLVREQLLAGHIRECDQ
jgi:hypothetical protein